MFEEGNTLAHLYKNSVEILGEDLVGDCNWFVSSELLLGAGGGMSLEGLSWYRSLWD